MNFSEVFIRRPVATTLLTLGVALGGVISYFQLPVAPLPQVDFPTISVTASLPGASPETMAATVATPLERALGAIAGVTEVTSSSSLGNTRVTLQFDLNRDINGAARDVQAAINASRSLLPSGMPSNPVYRKVNPADSPVMIIALTSLTLSRGQMYDAASTVLAQRLSQVEGIGQVNIGGGALPAVRVALDPNRLAANGLALEDVRIAISASNANRPKGFVEDGSRAWQVGANDQAFTAAEFAPTLLRYRNGNAVRLADVAEVTDSVQDVRNYGTANGQPAILLILTKAPNANIIEAVDKVRALLPQLQASISSAIQMQVVMDRTPTIRSSLKEMERALAIAIGLVILVVLLFLRSFTVALIPAVAVPVSLCGTFVVMHWCGYSLNNLSLMALTVATGFVVDDAIVVLENIRRRMERGEAAMQAAIGGAREIGFTVVSISLSLIAVFIPVLLMGGIMGRYFREFGVVLSAAILVSMVVSLTTTPMMCARMMRSGVAHAPAPAPDQRRDWMLQLGRRGMRAYRRSLGWALRYPWVTLLLLIGVVAWNVHLYGSISKGFFPQQDTGRIIGFIQADQATSFQAMQQRLDRFLTIARADPAVEHVTGFTGGAQRNSAQMFMSLKPLAERDASAEQVVARLRPKLAREAGANLFMVPVQDIRVGGRQANAAWQYTLQSDTLEDLRQWSQRIRFTMMALPEITDVNFDQQDRGMQTSLVIDRDAATRLGLTMRSIDATLNDAFGQRQIGVIYNPLNQYRVVMELASEHLQSPESLRSMVFINSLGERVPLLSFARMELTNTPLSVNHQSGTPATTIAFNLAPGVALSEATAAIEHTVAALGPPAGLRGTFQGTARAFAKSLDSQPLLILAALVTIYLVLGILYESLIHPITILSTLPSAGIGALLALQWFNTELSVIAFIGVILLIGIVKKNAIMMIDFAIDRQRRLSMSTGPAIYRAAHLRFRPILMTSVAAILGAVPLAAPQLFGAGDGAELRRPLGIAVVGGLVLSQILTLYTTPVVYLLMDRLRAAAAKIGVRPQLPQSADTSSDKPSPSNRGLTPILVAAVTLSACTTHAPAPEVAQVMQMPIAVEFKSSAHWKPVETLASQVPDAWWTLFADPVLNGLQERLTIGNENLKAAAAQRAAAEAALASSRAGTSPTWGLGASASHGVTPGGVVPTTTTNLSLNASWELDVWGRLAASGTAAEARLRASSADLAAARLSAQALLTQTYLQMRQSEAQAALLERSILGYQRSLELTQNRYRAGVVSAQDVAQATTQLRSTQAQLIDLQTGRAQLEHAIATLLGQPVARLNVARSGVLPEAPQVPAQLPSSLLQRRPDIAAQAARVAAAKAQFGVAEAAFFPQLTLTGALGYRGPDLLQLVDANQLFWSFGPSLALSLFDGGARQAGVDSARAGLDLAGAQYRQTVLTALQEVEDNLTGAAGLQENALLQSDALAAAAQSLTIADNQYKAGTVSYQSVVTAQTTHLAAQRALLDVQGRRLQALATLLKNLGGRWSPE